MNWFTALEQKRRFTLICINLLMVATIALTSVQGQRDPDAFWHLKMGQDWIEQGLSPLVVTFMLWWLKRIKAPVLVYGLVLPLLATVLQLRAAARPELLQQ